MTEKEHTIIDGLLTWEEDAGLDFKRVGSHKVKSFIKTAVAMANTEGGIIVFGIEDSAKATGADRLYGVGENPSVLDDFKRELSADVLPSLDKSNHLEMLWRSFPCKLRTGQMGEIRVCFVPKSGLVHSIKGGGTYARFGSQNRQLTANEITNLSLQRGVQSAVDAPADVPVELLETDWWKQYAEQRQLSRPFPDVLKHIGLSVPDGSEWKPSMAAVLLFAEFPGSLLHRKCAIRIFHYRGHEVEYQENTNLIGKPITIDGPLIQQIRKATDGLMNEIKSNAQVSVQGFEFFQHYPRRVIQEAITNAVLHRDYRLNEDIHIRIFTNRIEVQSPGVFPKRVSSENISTIGSNPRNVLIVNHLRDFPIAPNLDAGEGVRMMFQTLEHQGLYPPKYEESRDTREWVKVSLFNEARLSEWELIKDYLSSHAEICNADVRKILNLSRSYEGSRFLKGWVEKGLIEVSNPEAGTRYRKYKLVKTKGWETVFDRINQLLSEELSGLDERPEDGLPGIAFENEEPK